MNPPSYYISFLKLRGDQNMNSLLEIVIRIIELILKEKKDE